MIVKNEAPVIGRCLASVRPIISHWIIVDTGSSDGTQDLVRAALRGMPGALHERPWRDFAYNRSEALSLAQPHGDYTLIIDADDELILDDGFAMPRLEADSYAVDILDDGITYQRPQLVKSALPWRYRGVLHEFLTCESALSAGHAPIRMRRNHDGARRRDPSTYRKDAAVLETALREETDPFMRARYTFYLAQSYRDSGDPRAALETYRARAGMGFWDEEIFVSLLQAARILENLARSDPAIIDQDILDAYARATAARSTRAEALFDSSRFCRSKNLFEPGYEFARRGLAIPPPQGGLFVEPWIYDYGLLDELAVNAYWTGRYEACRDACDRLLREGKMPGAMKDRVAANRAFAIEKLQVSKPRPAPDWAPAAPSGGSEIMMEGLRRQMGGALDAINLRAHDYDPAGIDGRPLVLWIHVDIDQSVSHWLHDAEKVSRVDRFVFVSQWQRARYVEHFGLDAGRCVVLRNATAVEDTNRPWRSRAPLKMAYASAPFRGLSVLLDAWDILRPREAELHVWSSMKLYGPGYDDEAYAALYDRARATPGVIHHGIAPNEDLRRELRDCDFLTYPSTFAETSCLIAIEAMASGCRVICPSLGALAETVGEFGKVYPFVADPGEHARRFAKVLAGEIANPWGGAVARAIEQQDFARERYDWRARAGEWRALIESLTGAARAPRPAAGVPRVPPPGRVFASLSRLRNAGFRPGGIIDAGAYHGDFSRGARAVFPGAHILMIDALAENAGILAEAAAEIGNASHVPAMLGEAEQEAAPFFVVDTAKRPDLVKTGSSKFKENTDFPMEARVLGQRRLDSVIAEARAAGAPRFQFIKLDVQGAELEVLRGAGRYVEDFEAITLEMSLVEYNQGAPLIGAVMAELDAMGFVLYDIVEEHRYRDGGLLQIDGLFVRADSRFRPRPPFWS
jgi:FkbM family methyltransferase